MIEESVAVAAVAVMNHELDAASAIAHAPEKDVPIHALRARVSCRHSHNVICVLCVVNVVLWLWFCASSVSVNRKGLESSSDSKSERVPLAFCFFFLRPSFRLLEAR